MCLRRVFWGYGHSSSSLWITELNHSSKFLYRCCCMVWTMHLYFFIWSSWISTGSWGIKPLHPAIGDLKNICVSPIKKQSLLNLLSFTTKDVAVNGTRELKQSIEWNTGTHARDSPWKWATFHYQLKLATLSFLLLYHIQATSVKYLKHTLFFFSLQREMVL